jgi:hypothetical protein
MVTPEVVGHIDPVRLVELKDERDARESTCRVQAVMLAAGTMHAA